MHPYKSEADASQKRALQRCGGGGSVDTKVAEAVHKHERHDHKGEPLTKMKSGGAVPGKASGGRLDQRARGGRTKGPARVNIVISTGGGEGERQMAMKQGLQLGATMGRGQGGPPMPPRPPMPPPGAGAPPGLPPGGLPPGMVPPGAGMPPPGMPPRPPMKRGGKVKATPRKQAGGPQMGMTSTGTMPGGPLRLAGTPGTTKAKRGGKVARRDLGGPTMGMLPSATQMPAGQAQPVAAANLTKTTARRGGSVAYPLSGKAGSGGGMGRLEKKEAYEDKVSVRAHSRRKAGGRV